MRYNVTTNIKAAIERPCTLEYIDFCEKPQVIAASPEATVDRFRKSQDLIVLVSREFLDWSVPHTTGVVIS
jgi:hypothetical protein